jgi:hypothetical protein
MERILFFDISVDTVIFCRLCILIIEQQKKYKNHHMEEIDEYTDEMFGELMRSGIVMKSLVLIALAVLLALYPIEMLWIGLVAVILYVAWMYVIVPYMMTRSQRRKYDKYRLDPYYKYIEGTRDYPPELSKEEFLNEFGPAHRGFIGLPEAEAVPTATLSRGTHKRTLSPLDEAALKHKFVNYSRKPAGKIKRKPKRKPSTYGWGSLAKPPVTIDDNPTGWDREDLEITVGREEGRGSYNRKPIFSTRRLKDKGLRERILDQRISGLCDYYSVNRRSDSSDYTSGEYTGDSSEYGEYRSFPNRSSGASWDTFVSLPKDNRQSVKLAPRRSSRPAPGHVKAMLAQYNKA